MATAWRQLRQLLALKPARNTHVPYPKTRNIVLDILAEGRRKNTIQLLFDVDADAIRTRIGASGTASENAISITSYVASILARTVAANPRMHAYRHKRRKLVLFEDVDLSVMVEREVDGELLPLPYVVRAANRKSTLAVDAELKRAKVATLYGDGPFSALEAQFFALPRFLRKPVWWLAREDAHLFRELAGTVGVTSMGMHATGRAIVVPITPMTLTLSIGTIGTQWELADGVPIERHFLQLNLSANHDIVDGAPLMRFAATLRENLESGAS